MPPALGIVVGDSTTSARRGDRGPDRIASRADRPRRDPASREGRHRQPVPAQPERPAGVGVMAGKSVAEKLLLRPGARAWISEPSRAGLLGPLPEGATLVASPAGSDVAVVIVESGADVRA